MKYNYYENIKNIVEEALSDMAFDFGFKDYQCKNLGELKEAFTEDFISSDYLASYGLGYETLKAHVLDNVELLSIAFDFFNYNDKFKSELFLEENYEMMDNIIRDFIAYRIIDLIFERFELKAMEVFVDSYRELWKGCAL